MKKSIFLFLLIALLLNALHAYAGTSQPPTGTNPWFSVTPTPVLYKTRVLYAYQNANDKISLKNFNVPAKSWIVYSRDSKYDYIEIYGYAATHPQMIATLTANRQISNIQDIAVSLLTPTPTVTQTSTPETPTPTLTPEE